MARIPLARVPERLALYEAGLAESGLDAAAQQRLREQAAALALRPRRREPGPGRGRAGRGAPARRASTWSTPAPTHNPADFHVDASRVNPWNDPRVSDEDGARYSLETSALCGTAERVAEQVAELRDAGVHHVLCQMSFGYLPHARDHGVDAPLRRGRDPAVSLTLPRRSLG